MTNLLRHYIIISTMSRHLATVSRKNISFKMQKTQAAYDGWLSAMTALGVRETKMAAATIITIAITIILIETLRTLVFLVHINRTAAGSTTIPDLGIATIH